MFTFTNVEYTKATWRSMLIKPTVKPTNENPVSAMRLIFRSALRDEKKKEIIIPSAQSDVA